MFYTPDRGAASPTKARTFRKAQKAKNSVLAGECSAEFVLAGNFPWEREKKRGPWTEGAAMGRLAPVVLQCQGLSCSKMQRGPAV